VPNSNGQSAEDEFKLITGHNGIQWIFRRDKPIIVGAIVDGHNIDRDEFSEDLGHQAHAVMRQQGFWDD